MSDIEATEEETGTVAVNEEYALMYQLDFI